MTDIFRDKTHAEPENDVATTRTKLDDGDRFWTDAKLPGARKYPMDVVNVVRPRRGHDY